MFTYVNRGTLLIAILIIGISSFILPTLTDALPLSLWASCNVWSPWYTSETKAKASVTWSHARWIGGIVVAHFHSGRFSCHARVGANKPKKVENFPFFVSSLNSPVNKSHKEVDSGHPRWDGDAYASGAISEYGNPTNWKFCSGNGLSSF